MNGLKAILTYVIFATILTACNNDDTIDDSEDHSLPENIANDFFARYPDAIIDHFYLQRTESEATEITFTDKNGLSNLAVYQNDDWLSNRKEINIEADYDLIPQEVYDAYAQSGVKGYSHYEFIFEDSKIGFEQKQYQFIFCGPYDYGMGIVENYDNNIIILEDGTLLSYNDHHMGSPIIWPYDHRPFKQLAQDKYPDAKVIGSTFDGTNMTIFINENGTIKHVIICPKSNYKEMTWIKTWYPLDINTELPDFAIANKKEYEAQHPEAVLTSIKYEEDNSGKYYGMTFHLTKDYGEVIYSEIK